MKNGLVTVVIPVYKTEKYLDRCLESIVNQTYRNLEIILVDDGSPEPCPQMCEEWAAKDSRIRVVHKMNAGLGMARNTGIDHATGEYICFCDSDDYVALDTIEHAVALAKSDCSDVVLYGLNMVSATGEVLGAYSPCTEKDCYEGAEVLEFLLPNMIEGSSKVGRNFNLNMSSCACLFSMKLIADSQWRFVSEREIISEDFYSLLCLYANVRRASILKKACYFYCYNSASLSHVFRADRYERVCHCYSVMLDKCRQLQYPKNVVQSVSVQYLGNAIGTMKTVVSASDHGIVTQLKLLKEMIKSETMKDAMRRIDFASESFERKLLITAMKVNCSLAVYLMIKAKA